MVSSGQRSRAQEAQERRYLISLSQYAIQSSLFLIDEEGARKAVSKRSLGEVELAVQWWFNPTLHKEFFTEFDDDEWPKSSPNQLMVAVSHAHGLLAMDRKLFSSGGGSSDPLVKLRCVRCDDQGKVLPLPPGKIYTSNSTSLQLLAHQVTGRRLR